MLRTGTQTSGVDAPGVEQDSAMIIAGQGFDTRGLDVEKPSEQIPIEVEISKIEASQQQKIRQTYQAVLSKKFNEQLQKHLLAFLERLDDPALKDLKQAIVDNMPGPSQVALLQFMDKKDREAMDYEQIKMLYTGVQESIEKTIKNPRYKATADGLKMDPLLNAASRGLAQLAPLATAQIPEMVGTLNTIAGMKEVHHYKKTKKKSWFRRMIETVLPMLKKDTVEHIRHEVEQIGSLQKAVASIAAEKVAESMRGAGDQFFNEFDNAFKAERNRIEKQKKLEAEAKKTGKEQKFTKEIDIAQNTKQAETRQAKAQPPQSTGGIGSGLYNLAMGVAKGVLEYVGYQTSSISTTGQAIEELLHVDESITHKKLADHVEDVFDMAAKRDSFDGLLNYTQQLFLLYLTADRAKSNHEIGLKSKDFGFQRFDDPAFKQYMVDLTRSLGFKVESFNDLHTMLMAPSDMSNFEVAHPDPVKRKELEDFYKQIRQDAFNNYSEAKPSDKVVGMHAAASVLTKEHNTMLAKNQKGSHNYFYLLDLNKQVVESLQSQTRKVNAVKFMFRELQLEQNIYNPDRAGFSTTITSQVKARIVQALPGQIDNFLGDAHDKKELAKAKFFDMNQNWLDEVSMRINRPDLVQERKDHFLRRKDPTPAEQVQGWENAVSHSQKALVESSTTQSLTDVFFEKAAAQWKKSAVPFLSEVSSFGNAELFAEVKRQLDIDLAKLKADGAHPDFIQDLENKITSLNAMLTTDGNGFDANALLLATPEQLKMAIDALAQGTKGIYKNSGSLTTEERQDLFMVNQAIGQIQNAYVLPNMVQRLYNDVYLTNLDEINALPPSGVGQYFAKVLGEKFQGVLQSSMLSPVTQFHNYVQNRNDAPSDDTIEGRRRFEVDRAPKPQGWLEWGMEKVSGYSTYGQYAYNVISPLVLGGLEAVGSYAFSYIRDDMPKDKKSMNDAIVESCQSYTRQQAFDAMMNIASQLATLSVLGKAHQAEHGKDVLKALGFVGNKRVDGLLDEIAKGLGFSNASEIIAGQSKVNDANNRVTELEGQLQKLKTELLSIEGGTAWNYTAGWFNSAETKEKIAQLKKDIAQAEQNLQGAQQELNTAKSEFDAVIKTKRDAFAQVPKTSEAMHVDNFVSLKLAVQSEYAKLTAEASQGKLQNASHYTVMLAAMNNVISQVELVQRETLAVALMGPDLDKQLGYDPSAKGMLAELKAAYRGQVKDAGIAVTQQAIMSQLQGALQDADGLARDILRDASHTISAGLSVQPVSSELTTSAEQTHHRPKALVTTYDNQVAKSQAATNTSTTTLTATKKAEDTDNPEPPKTRYH